MALRQKITPWRWSLSGIALSLICLVVAFRSAFNFLDTAKMNLKKQQNTGKETESFAEFPSAPKLKTGYEKTKRYVPFGGVHRIASVEGLLDYCSVRVPVEPWRSEYKWPN